MKKLLCIFLSLSMMLSISSSLTAFAVSDEVQADADALTLDDVLSVPGCDTEKLIDNLEIDRITVGEVNGSPITWESSNTDVITDKGIVKRGALDADVTLTATIGSGDDVIEKTFDFTVPAASKSINRMPVMVSSTYSDDFSDGTLGFETNFPQTNGDYYKEENGKAVLNVSESTWGKEYYIRTRPVSTGTFAYEFTLGGDSNSFRVQCIESGFASKPLDMLIYRKDGRVEINGEGYSVPASVKDKNWKFTVYFDMNTDKLTMWLNNEVFIESLSYTPANDVSIFNVAILATGQYDGRGCVYLDNFKVYEATPSPLFEAETNIESILNEYPAYVSADGTKYITNNLNFDYKKDALENTYAFSSDNTSVVSPEGIITRQNTDEEVKITATVTDKDGEYISKSFDYVVPGKYNKIGKENLPAQGQMINYEAYSSPYTPNAKAFSVAPSANNGALNITLNNDAECFIVLSKDLNTAQKSGKRAYEIIFDMEKNSGKFYGVMSYQLVGSARTTVLGGVQFNMNGDASYPVIKYGSKSFDGLLKMTIVADRDNNNFDLYVNDVLADEDIAFTTAGDVHGVRLLFKNTNGNKGFYNVYSTRAYDIDENAYSSIMKGEEIYSNDGIPVVGKNTVSIPVIATDSTGEAFGGTLVYAIYEVCGNIKELAGIDVVELGLDKFSHKNYSVNVTLDSVGENMEQRVFIFNNIESIVPISAEEFPIA